jgi:hypothetical protein
MRTSPPRFWLTIVSKKRFGIPQILGRGFESQTDLNNTLVACKASGARIAFAGSPRKTEATILPFPERRVEKFKFSALDDMIKIVDSIDLGTVFVDMGELPRVYSKPPPESA